MIQITQFSPRNLDVAKFLKLPSAAAPAHSPPWDTRYPIARNTYIKPMVAIIGGTAALEITRPTTAPQAAPIAMADYKCQESIGNMSVFQ